MFILMGTSTVKPYFSRVISLEYYGEYKYIIDEVRPNSESRYYAFIRWTNEEIPHSFEEKVDLEEYNSAKEGYYSYDTFTVFTTREDEYTALKGSGVTMEMAKDKYKPESFAGGLIMLAIGGLYLALQVKLIILDKLSKRELKKGLVENEADDISRYKPFY